MATSIAIILELHMGMHMQLFHAKSEINGQMDEYLNVTRTLSTHTMSPRCLLMMNHIHFSTNWHYFRILSIQRNYGD